MIFLSATMDLQQSAAYERALALLQERHGQGAVTADRDLFESFKQWRKTFKEVYGKAEILYVLAREDGTVGLGVYKQCRYADKQGIPQVLMFADEQGKLSESKEYERFGLQRLDVPKGEEDLARFAVVSLQSP